jgi:hypothetical protein
MRTWKAVLFGFATAGLLAASIPAAAPPVAEASVTVTATGAVRAPVPWNRVGPGWVLAEYSPDSSVYPAALYLVGPQGTRYRLASWPGSMSYPPNLMAWSPDGTRAFFSLSPDATGKLEQLNLTTGKATIFRLAGGAIPVTYAPPHGTDIVGAVAAGISGNLFAYGRYSQTGALVARLGSYAGLEIKYSPSGSLLAVNGRDGLELVSDDGVLIRRLAIPGVAEDSCDLARWWDSDTILASCNSGLWLVPVSGAPATHLVANAHLGSIDAWRLNSGVYVQTSPIQYPIEFPVQPATDCAVTRIFKRAANGTVRPVTIPGINGIPFDQVLTAIGSRLLVQVTQVSAACSQESQSLLWFDTATGAEQWLVRAPAGAFGVTTAIAFYPG